jgi:hypothetical protein
MSIYEKEVDGLRMIESAISILEVGGAVFVILLSLP